MLQKGKILTHEYIIEQKCSKITCIAYQSGKAVQYANALNMHDKINIYSIEKVRFYELCKG